ncbi:MAG: TolC family protein [Planctomycetota bacterium]
MHREDDPSTQGRKGSAPTDTPTAGLPHPFRRIGSIGLIAAAGLGFGLGLGGCHNSPLFESDSDYDTRVSLARLRAIEPLDLSNAAGRTPEQALADSPPGKNLAELKAKFEPGEPVELSIEEARAAALENNLDLRVALVAPEIAAERVNEEQGRFEAVLFGNFQSNETDDAVALSTQTAGSRSYFFQPGVRVPLRTGGQFEVQTTWLRNLNNNPFATLNPAYTTDFEVSITQQLLRGAGRKSNSFQIRIADYDRQISLTQSRLEVIRQLTSSAQAYWRLYASRAALEVRYQQYVVALEQLERARRRFNAGQQPEIEVVRAESGLADRIEAIIQAENNVLLNQRDLKRIMNLPGLGIDDETPILTTTVPNPIEYTLDGTQLADAAMDQRMELLELELRLAGDAATIAFRENAALPSLGVSLTYRANGIGGDLNESLNVIAENEFEDYVIGLNGEIPLGNRQRRSSVEQAVLTRLQRIATRDARRVLIRQEVLDAVTSIETGWQRILAARQAVLLNSRSLEAEERQFNVGRSTSTDVLDADARLADARLSEIQAVVEYEISQVLLAQATGTLLGQSGVEWSPLDPRLEDGAEESEKVDPGIG